MLDLATPSSKSFIRAQHRATLTVGAVFGILIGAAVLAVLLALGLAAVVAVAP